MLRCLWVLCLPIKKEDGTDLNVPVPPKNLNTEFQDKHMDSHDKSNISVREKSPPITEKTNDASDVRGTRRSSPHNTSSISRNRNTNNYAQQVPKLDLNDKNLNRRNLLTNDDAQLTGHFNKVSSSNDRNKGRSSGSGNGQFSGTVEKKPYSRPSALSQENQNNSTSNLGASWRKSLEELFDPSEKRFKSWDSKKNNSYCRSDPRSIEEKMADFSEIPYITADNSGINFTKKSRAQNEDC